jgi:6-phosphofructokinase 1
VLVAEGAGQDLLEASSHQDASGHKKLGDIGPYLTDQIRAHFQKRKIEVSARYIDPSYIIRSAPANANDSIYCARLGTHAVHAAMAGKTGLLVSLIHNQFVHVPIPLAVAQRHVIAPEKELWRDVVAATGQPRLMKNGHRLERPEEADTPNDPALMF